MSRWAVLADTSLRSHSEVRQLVASLHTYQLDFFGVDNRFYRMFPVARRGPRQLCRSSWSSLFRRWLLSLNRWLIHLTRLFLNLLERNRIGVQVTLHVRGPAILGHHSPAPVVCGIDAGIERLVRRQLHGIGVPRLLGGDRFQLQYPPVFCVLCAWLVCGFGRG